MVTSKKPDNIVWDEKKQEYFAKLMPYATTNNSPIIKIPNVDTFKKKGVEKVSKHFQAELQELQEMIKKFIITASDTQAVYSANFKFDPIIGEIYHLYEDSKGDFLSLISPNDWDKKHLGSFRLNSDYKWHRVE
tara:strand:- start:867 stop:1268 length:402 start_codon:yes stop_codon:yes gene_type:complete